jgi:hypothetical protein
VSDIENPWQIPQSQSVAEQPLTGQAVLTDTMLRYLREASPWLRFIGILGYIGSGLMCAGGLIFAIVLFAGVSLFEELGAIAGGLGGFIGLLYLALGALLFLPARFTYTFGAKINSYLLGNSERELELAFRNNKSLWKFYGILCIINLAFVPLMVIGGIVAAISSVFSAFM